MRELELAYEKNLRETDLICDRERARQLRVCILLLEDENLDLHAQLAQNHDRIDDLGRYSDQILAELDVVERRFDFVQSDLRLKSRQVETLNVGGPQGVIQGRTTNLRLGRTGLYEQCFYGFNQVADGEAFSGSRIISP